MNMKKKSVKTRRLTKCLSLLLSVIMLCAMLPMTALAFGSIYYIDVDGTPRFPDNVTELTSGSTALSAGWYAVTANTQNDDRITCTGDVNLILCDGATLTAPKGIAVNEDSNDIGKPRA